MASGVERFKHESIEDSETIVNYLNALREGFENGALLFCSDDRRLVLKPHGLINLDVETKRKGHEVKLNLKFKWVEESVTEEAGRSPLHIRPIAKE